jgi:CBS domain-containing protein
MEAVRVRDVMTRLVVTLPPAAMLREAAVILASNGISGAPVTHEGRIVGMLSENDVVSGFTRGTGAPRYLSILDALAATDRVRPTSPPRTTVADVMTRAVATAAPEMSILDAARRMEERGVKRLPVVDEDEELVGIVSRADVIRGLTRRVATSSTQPKRASA